MGKYLKLLSLFFLTLVFLFVVFPASAEDSSTATTSGESSSSASQRVKSPDSNAIKERIQNAKEKNLEIKDALHRRASEAAQKRTEKLSESRLKMCEARSKGISQRVKLMLERGKVIHKGNQNVYERVDEFYNKKLVPAGYTLPNYADLKAEVEANKANVQTLLDSAKTTGLNFNCSAEDPKGQIDEFKQDVKALIDANKAYKESVHTFVKAVRDLAKAANLEKVSPSPTTEATQ